ncbi:MAG: PaaI family thioesterase [Quadrisphaera sp.]
MTAAERTASGGPSDTAGPDRVPQRASGPVVPPGVPLGELPELMGIRVQEMSAERAVGTMPVLGNRQPFGRLHGGAHLVLAETLASLAAWTHAGPGREALGVEIGASHTGGATSGVVTGTCEALSLGRTLTVHEVVVRDEAGRRLSTVRVTNLLRDTP